MLRSGFAIDETSAPAITPDLLTEMKKQDMKQAIVERFSYRAKAVSAETGSGQKNARPTGNQSTKSADRPLDVARKSGACDAARKSRTNVYFSFSIASFHFSDPTRIFSHYNVLERTAKLRYLPRCKASRASASCARWAVRRLWVLQVHSLQRVHHDVGDGQMREPLMIGRNDVPGRVLGAGVVDHVLVRLHVVIPALAARANRLLKTSSSSLGHPIAPGIASPVPLWRRAGRTSESRCHCEPGGARRR